MPTNTSGGTTTSFNNTPQAVDDFGIACEDSIFAFDVMANDLGGNAKILWSIDDADPDGTTVLGGTGDNTIDLLAKDAALCPEFSTLGARIWIENGQIKYDTNGMDSLAAGQTVCDTFTYAIRLSNGTLSWATVSVALTGTNDAPTITSADSSGAVTEDTNVIAGQLHDSGYIGFADVDLTDVHTVSVAPNSGDYLGVLTAVVSGDSTNGASGQVTWQFDVNNADVQYLGAGDTLTQTYAISVSDGHGGTATQTITVTIHGTNDVPVISGNAAGDTNEDGQLVTGGQITIVDTDTGESLFVAIPAGTDGASSHGTFAVDETGVWSYTLDNSDPAVQALGEGDTATDSIVVTSLDGTASQTITVTIHGTNDVPVIDHAIGTQQTDEDTAWSFVVPSDTFSDLDGDALGYSAMLANGDPLPSWLSFDAASRTFSGTPPLNFNGTIALAVVASDGHASVTNTFNLNINPINDAPDASPLTLTAIAEDSGPRLITQAELLAGVSDVDSAGLTITAVTIGSGSGTLADNHNGTWTYTPAHDDDTSVTFNYTASDGSLTDTSTATMDITPVADFVYQSPAPFTGTGDPNDFDGL
jgi:VCBS repeat-containing protein